MNKHLLTMILCWVNSISILNRTSILKKQVPDFNIETVPKLIEC